jgi:CheY-specific phosphatase CheX
MTTKPTTLTTAISEVIENLTMMVVEEPESCEGFVPQLKGDIEFTGPVNGSLSISCSEGLSQKLAANLLGIEQDNTETQASSWDALAELLNVVCGNLVTSLYDSSKPFNLSSPQINVIEPAEPSVDGEEKSKAAPTPVCSNDDAQRALLLLDGEMVEFTLTIAKK